MPKKGKGKKSKDGKKGKKKDSEKEESIAKLAQRNSNIWEAKLKMTEFHKDHYKDTVRQLAEENTSLIDFMKQTEKDTIDVVSYLRKLDAEKEAEIHRLQEELKTIDQRYENEKNTIITDFKQQIDNLQDRLDKKVNEAELLENELNQLKEFRKKKIQMQKELEEIKEAMVLNEKEHKDHMSRVEEKFFEEKMRLQIEANKKIEELAEKAHDAAIKNLDDITRNIYKENVQLTESFKLNTHEIESLRKQNKALLIENEKLRGESEGNGALVKEKVDLAYKQSKQIKELQNKVEILEKSLSQVVREFEIERTNIIKKCKLELESSTTELEKMQKTMELKNKEMNKVKKLAKNILEQRGEIERFFLESLDYVKQQIITNRNEYRKEASALYNNRMLAAHMGQIDYPKVRTFSKKFDAFSTNSVFKDLEQAEKWSEWHEHHKKYNLNEVVDIVDLTWEQKEQVLRELFARMNGTKVKGDKNKSQNKSDLAVARIDDSQNVDSNDEDDSNVKSSKSPKNKESDFTFITQSSVHVESTFSTRSMQDQMNSIPKLPSITSPLQNN